MKKEEKEAGMRNLEFTFELARTKTGMAKVSLEFPDVNYGGSGYRKHLVIIGRNWKEAITNAFIQSAGYMLAVNPAIVEHTDLLVRALLEKGADGFDAVKTLWGCDIEEPRLRQAMEAMEAHLDVLLGDNEESKKFWRMVRGTGDAELGQYEIDKEVTQGEEGHEQSS